MNINPNILNCSSAPISEAWSWRANRDNSDLLDVCQAVPAYLPHQSLLDHLGQTIMDGKAATYTDITGIAPLREALSRDINDRYQSNISAQHISITAGCNQGFCSTIDTLCQAGDEVIATLPCYFNHDMWFSIRGINVKWLDFNEDTAIPHPEQIAAKISANTKAIVLVSPNNPTGAIYPPNVLAEFYRVAKQHDVALIIDETYRDFMDPDAPPHSLFSEPDWESHFIHLYSFSKSFSLTGHRVGAVAAGRDFLVEMGKIQDCVAISAPHAGQVAALYGLNNLIDWRTENGRRMTVRGAAISEAFKHSDLNYELVSAGAYFAYVKHPFDQSSRTVAKRLAEDFDVLSLPSAYFGQGQEQYLRLAFANLTESRFPELINRLIQSQV